MEKKMETTILLGPKPYTLNPSLSFFLMESQIHVRKSERLRRKAASAPSFLKLQCNTTKTSSTSGFRV